MSELVDPIIAEAEKRRDELREDLRKIEDFIATYYTLKNRLKMDSRNTKGTKSAEPSTDLSTDAALVEAAREAETPYDAQTKRVRVSDNPKPATVVAAAVEVIRAAGRPMTRRKIHKALAARGLEVRGSDPIKALGTMLWRSGKGQLVQIEGRGYGLKDVEYDLDGLFAQRAAE